MDRKQVKLDWNQNCSGKPQLSSVNGKQLLIRSVGSPASAGSVAAVESDDAPTVFIGHLLPSVVR
jgi:hypothetical protein